MSKLKFGIVKEGKTPTDRRVPLIPKHIQKIFKSYNDIEIKVQKSSIRCFTDNEYEKNNIPLVDDVNDCDILLGVKEVPLDELVENRTYFFFSHTIKKQAYNRELLKTILQKNIRLIDYECLTDINGKRLIAFGRYAGIVGAYNGIYFYGKRYNLFDLKRAKDCFDLDELKKEFQKVKLPSIKIVLTGGGRVSRGAMEVLNAMGIRKVSPKAFINKYFEGPVYTQLNGRDYNLHKENKAFNRSEFYQYPERYQSDFLKYAKEADLLIAGAFWDPKAPTLFTREDILKNDFEIKVIADITCDIEGSIPCTKRPCTVDDPIYDYNPSEDKVEPPLSDEANITVMAVDNLPSELPRNASEDFGNEMVENVIGNIIEEDKDDVIKRATITEDGKLTKKYSYLQSFVDGK